MPTCPHCSACQCRPPRLTTGGAHHDGGLPDGCTKRWTAVRKRQCATWHQLSGIRTKLEHQRKQQSHLIQILSPWNRRYRGNNQRSVSSWICHIRVDQSGPDDLWHSLEVTTGGVPDQLLWDDFQRSFRTKILPVQSQNSSDIPAQFLSRKSVKKINKSISTIANRQLSVFQTHLDIYLTCVCVCEPPHGPAGSGWRPGLARPGSDLPPTDHQKTLDPVLFSGQGLGARHCHLLRISQCQGAQKNNLKADLCLNPPEWRMNPICYKSTCVF